MALVLEELKTNLGEGSYVKQNYYEIPIWNVYTDYNPATTPFDKNQPLATLRNQSRILTPDIDDHGTINNKESATEYYHFKGRGEYERRLTWAIRDQDLQAFGRALHGYQDSFSHASAGYSVGVNVAGIGNLYQNCPECFQEDFWGSVRRSHNDWGHAFFNKHTDLYDPSNPRDVRMANGTQYWITMYILDASGIDADSYYLEHHGMTHEEWYQTNVVDK